MKKDQLTLDSSKDRVENQK